MHDNKSSESLRRFHHAMDTERMLEWQELVINLIFSTTTSSDVVIQAVTSRMILIPRRSILPFAIRC